jgi:hypothetical protein
MRDRVVFDAVPKICSASIKLSSQKIQIFRNI